MSKLRELKSSFSELQQLRIDNNSIFSLYVVGLASCIEVAVRHAVCKLIDHGSPYVERIPDLMKNELRFNLDIIKALQNQKITFGDFISHLIPISGAAHINSHLNTLLDGKLCVKLTNLKQYREIIDPTWFETEDEQKTVDNITLDEDEDSPNIVTDVNTLMANLDHLFKFRHIIAHESDFQSISLNDLYIFFSASEVFIETLDELVEQTLSPNEPRSGYDTSLVAQMNGTNTFNSMDSTYQELLTTISENLSTLFEYLPNNEQTQVIDKLKVAQNTFLKYFEEELSFQFHLFRPSNGNALRFSDAQVYTSLCKSREERLQDVLNQVKEYIETFES